MYCWICEEESAFDFCINCDEDHIKKCYCGVLYDSNYFHICSQREFILNGMTIRGDYDIIKSLNDYHYRDIKSSGIVFDKIYDSLTNNNNEEAIKLINNHVNEISIFVKTLTGSTITLKISPRLDIIYPIKLLIEKSQGTPINQQRLIYAGQQMDNDRTYKFVKEMTIHMVLRMSGD